LLRLPHRQFVWTIPKVLRVFLRHDRELQAAQPPWPTNAPKDTASSWISRASRTQSRVTMHRDNPLS
jgi:hypothetical protein